MTETRPVSPKRLWITWEHQRRSVEMASHFGCNLVEIIENGLQRYPKSILRTLKLLISYRGKVVFVQNPSMILATMAVLFGSLTGTTIVVDRHSTFPDVKKHGSGLKYIVFRTLHFVSIRLATLTIVTNEHLAEAVRKLGGSPFVLPDPLPNITFDRDSAIQESANHSFFVVCSFATDEPIAEVIDATASLSTPKPTVFISGNTARAPREFIDKGKGIVTFTGFLPDNEYYNKLASVDAVIVLTTADHTLMCGCYEAVAAGQVLITSNTDVLKDYFSGAIFVDNSASSIADAMNLVINENTKLRNEARNMKTRIASKWEPLANQLEQFLRSREYRN